MSHAPEDPRWPRLLGLAVHEFRTPLSVVAGYVRMLLKDRAGPVTDVQRKLLEEAEKSCGRLSALLTEMSDLANLEAGTGAFNRSSLALDTLLREAVDTLPAVPDREVSVSLELRTGTRVAGDAVRLKTAFTSILTALRRELISPTGLVVREIDRDYEGRPAVWIGIAGDAAQVDADLAADLAELTVFDEWRGGVGLSLAVARRIINAHGGTAFSPPDRTKAAAVIVLPRS